MVIISIRLGYGWRTLSFSEFFQQFEMARRKQLVDDSANSQIVESGECMDPREARLFLEQLEVRCLRTAEDYETFLRLYPQSKFRNHVRNCLQDLESESAGLFQDQVASAGGGAPIAGDAEGPLAEAMRNVALMEQEETDPEYFILIPETVVIAGNTGEPAVVPAFFMDRIPVTNRAYARFVEATDAVPPASWARRRPPLDRLDHPVVDVPLKMAQAYAHWSGCRLPTSLEWQAASSGEGRTLFPWGTQDWDPARCNNPETGPGETTAVEAYPGGVSRNGCLDLVGNVWEWTSDDAAAADDGDEEYASVFGGSFRHSCADMDGVAETRVLCANSYPYLGFRCAADYTLPA